MDIKGHTVTGDDRPGRPHRRGVLLLHPARPREPHLPGHVLQGGRHGHRAARRRAARGPGPRRRRPQRRHRRRQGPEIVEQAGFDAETAAKIEPVLKKLWDVYRDEDATLVEVNPLVKHRGRRHRRPRRQGLLDANADFRHPEHEALEDKAETDPLEAAAKEKDLNYVKLDGSVGIIGNGAGLVMSTLDVVAYAGEEFGGQKPANFLDIGGGASAQVMADGLHIILSDPQVKASSSTSSAASPPVTPSPTASSGRSTPSATRRTKPAGRPPRRQQRRGGSAHPRGAQPPPSHHRGDDGRRARRAAELASQA
jgi:hypothetical protein